MGVIDLLRGAAERVFFSLEGDPRLHVLSRMLLKDFPRGLELALLIARPGSDKRALLLQGAMALRQNLRHDVVDARAREAGASPT